MARDLDAVYAGLEGTGLVARLAALAREEDLGAVGDVTSRACVEAGRAGVGRVVAREDGVVAGVRALPAILWEFGPALVLEAGAADGDRVAVGATVAGLRGPLREILAAERTVLNVLGRLSGVATLTAGYVGAVSGTRARVYDTRKTTPGLRVLEKYAVCCGGGESHRLGLHDAVLIKDNHLAGVRLDRLAAFVAGAAARAREMVRAAGGPALLFVEVEVDTLEQLRVVLEAGGCGADVVLLDNMGVEGLAEAVAMRDAAGAPVLLEASGGVTLGNVRAVAETGVERISVGALTHGAPWVDFSMEVEG